MTTTATQLQELRDTYTSLAKIYQGLIRHDITPDLWGEPFDVLMGDDLFVDAWFKLINTDEVLYDRTYEREFRVQQVREMTYLNWYVQFEWPNRIQLSIFDIIPKVEA